MKNLLEFINENGLEKGAATSLYFKINQKI